MSYGLLRRAPVAKTPPGVGCTVRYEMWGRQARRRYPAVVQAPDNTGNYAPFELSTGDRVSGADTTAGTLPASSL